MKRKEPKDYHVLAKKRGFEWLGLEVFNNSTKTFWKCPVGHEWETTYQCIQHGTGCPYCANKVPKTIEDYHNLAKKRGFMWLGDELPENTYTKTFWRCPEGHKWETRYCIIRQGKGCPNCALVGRRKGAQDYHDLAEEKGFKWLGLEVTNTRTKTRWECSKGHQWESCYGYIQQGKGCPYCANRVPKTIEDYYILAGKSGFEWIDSGIPKNSGKKTLWRCSEGHEWETCYSNIQQGNGCPVCGYKSMAKKQRKKPVNYYALAKEHGFKWIGPEVSRSDIKTFWRCSMDHEWKTSYNSILQGKGCPYCSNKVPKTIENYHRLAESRGFEWLGPEASRNTVKTWWRCSEGHEWETSYSSIQQGYGCHYCSGYARKTSTDYHKLAEKRGFKWIGEELPKGVIIKTRWKCKKGHEWEACHVDIRRDSGCPTCVDIVNGAKVSGLQRQIHKMMGGVLNHPCGPYKIDVALLGKKIAIEYDCWFWHGHKHEYDAKRDAFLLARDWKILHIKTRDDMPSKWELEEAIAKLENGEERIEIVLDDWGKGLTFADVRAQKKVDPWEKGPTPISLDGVTFTECQQLWLWRNDMPTT